jgi:ATP-dependent protease ClpP protease subunit
MKLIGFAELGNIDPRLVFAAGDAGVFFRGETFPAEIRIVARRGRAAVAFQIDESTPETWALHSEHDLAAHALVSARNGLVVIDCVELKRPGHGELPTCWRDGVSPLALGDYRRGWWAHCTMLSASSPMLLPIEGRPHGKGEPLAIAIVGEIGERRYGGEELAARIRSNASRSIILTIDSPGGTVDDGMPIYRALAEHPHRVECEIINRAESMAAIVALAADERRMVADGHLLLHQTTLPTPVSAQPCDLRRVAAKMEKMHGEFAAIVADACGCGLETAKVWIENETTFNAGDALRVGLVHRSVRPAIALPPLYSVNGRYLVGDRVRHQGNVYAATRNTFGAPGLAPDRDRKTWEPVNAY